MTTNEDRASKKAESGAEDQSSPSSFISPLGWAAFLACSWTWCIGMFLPVLLVRDYGIWGWVIFAIPNVIGAAAMGWTVRDADASRRLVAAHAPACAWFSIITLAFHVFWLIWLSRLFSGLWAAALVSAAAVYLVGGVRLRGDRVTGVIVLVVSLICFAIETVRHGDGLASARWAPAVNGGAVLPMLGLAVACCFGFALCPYLDLTFHRARQGTTPRAGRSAFALGFGLFFLLMIGFTLVYAVDLQIARFVPRVSHAPTRGLSPWHIVAIHIAVQAGYTVAVHARALRNAGGIARSRYMQFASPLAGVIAVVVGVTAYRHAAGMPLSTGELAYRLFLSFYGLVFPAYVWLCMVPTWRSPRVPATGTLRVFVVAVLLAGPFYYLAFIEQKMGWVAVGVAIVLLARLLVGGRPLEPALA